MNNTHAPSAARTWRNVATLLVLGTMLTAAFADIDYIERSGKDWIATPRVPGDFTSVAPSVNTLARIFTANASGGVEGRDLPSLAVAFRSATGHYIDLAARKNGGAKTTTFTPSAPKARLFGSALATDGRRCRWWTAIMQP